MNRPLFKLRAVAVASGAALTLFTLGSSFSLSAHALTYQFRKVAPGLVAAPTPTQDGGSQPQPPVAPAPTYVLDASSAIVSFGQAELGQPSVRSVELLNRGTGMLELGEVTTSGAGFAAETNCAGPLPAGASCQAQITFTPSALGSYSGELTVPSNATAGTLGISLTGSGVALGTLSGLLSASPGSVLFDAAQVGSTSSATLVLTNTGAAALALGTPVVSGSGFALQGSTCTAVLQPSATCSLTLQFAPTGTQVVQGNVQVPTNGPAGALSASLQGQGYTVSASVTPTTSADYGTVNVGSSVSRSFTFTNTGTRTLTQSYAVAVGTAFSLSANTCGTAAAPLSLAPGQSCQVTAVFAPASGGTPSNRVQFLAQELAAEGVSQAVTATAVGAVTATPSSLNFGSLSVGTSSSASVVTLTNTTGAARTLTIGAAPAGYTRTTTCAASLANGSSCTVSVSFSPTAAGAANGTLSISSDISSHPVALSGSGVLNATLVSPNYSLFYEGKHPAWMETGHAWTWATSGYVSNAAGGTINVQGLLPNATGSARTVTLYYSVDDAMPSIKLNNVEVPRPACGGHTTLCTVSLSLPPGTSLISMTPQNGSGPAGFSAWVVDSGTVLLSTSNTSGAKAWTRF